mgnify:CR=1 FL=1
MATRLLTVDTLPVAKRWLKRMQDERKGYAKRKIGIWEKPRQTTKGVYSTNSDCRYVVGQQQSVETRVNHLGKRIA